MSNKANSVPELDFIGTIKKSGNNLGALDYPYFDDIDDERAYYESSIRMSKHDKEMIGYLDQLEAWLFMAGRNKHYTDYPENLSVQQKQELEIAEKKIQNVLDRIDSMFMLDDKNGGKVLDRVCCDI